MYSIRLPRGVLAICLSYVAMQGVSAQIVGPTNDTSADNTTTTFSMTTTLSKMKMSPEINPLTNHSGLTGSLNELENINPTGSLILVTPQNVANLKQQSIAYMSCEPGDYDGNLDAAKTMDIAASRQPDAIVLYSAYASQCTFAANGFDYDSIYTMLSANQSVVVLEGLQKQDPPNPPTSITVNQQSINGSSQGNDNSGGNVLGKSPTTAVAMIILYSITGIITFLFLAIIVIGAIRAHRHPERYGPRRMVGRPRQSRARGIARAMLETLPIVKFGDTTDDKPPEPASTGSHTARDIELGETRQTETAAERQESEGHATDSHTHPPVSEGPDVVVTEPAGAEPAKEEAIDPEAAADHGLACSVCTDDFVKGQDIRVLPCKHKFHPECIDPWLLNVSGTCPLCRVDLQPRAEGATHDEDEFDDGPTLETLDTTYVEPTDHQNHRNRRSRILSTLNIGRMRHATPEERIAALRRLRSENLSNDSTAEPSGSTMNRFSRRVSRVLGGSRPHSGVQSRRDSEVPAEAVERAVGPNSTTETAPTPTPTRSRFGRSPLSSGAATPAERNPRRRSSAAAAALSPARSRPGSPVAIPPERQRTPHPTVEAPSSVSAAASQDAPNEAPPAVTAPEATTASHEEGGEQSPPNTAGSGSGSVRRSIREYHLLSPITSSSSTPRSP